MHPHRTWKCEQRILYDRYYIRHKCKRKDLGDTVSVDMTVSEQCAIAASKDNPILGLITGNMEKTLIISLYKAIVRPYLQYCIYVWRPCHKIDINKLERMQRRD